MDELRLEVRELVYPYGSPAYRWELIGRTPTGDVSIAESTRTFSTEPLARLHFEHARIAVRWMPSMATDTKKPASGDRAG